MKERIRQVIREQGHLAVDIDGLPDDADLYQAGMTSHASVNVMIALEDTFAASSRASTRSPPRCRKSE
jgi:acyl carrier protein